MKRLFIVILIVLCGANIASAQRVMDYVDRLAIPEGSAQVVVKTDGKSSAAINSSSAIEERVPGFRVCIFFDNGQAARQAATAAQNQLLAQHPGLTNYLVYTNPVWKIMVGDCLTRSEATHLMGILRSNFPKAFIVNESIPIKNLIMTQSSESINTNAGNSDEQLVPSTL